MDNKVAFNLQLTDLTTEQLNLIYKQRNPM